MSDSEQENVIPSAQPVAPPTQPGTIAAPQRPANWPKVIGTIAIVFGSGGILVGLWGAASPFGMRLFEWAMEQSQPSAVVDRQVAAMQAWLPWTVGSSLLAVAIAILLLLGGVRLTKRKRSSMRLLKFWAVMQIPVVVIVTIAEMLMQERLFEIMGQSPGGIPMPFGGGFADLMLVVGLVFGLAWGWALPVFLLIWLTRGKIKNEVAGWT
ncbi:MAG: hypothetical protein IID34_17775 [Planctomycetes bacterium]|nr:hypothetical protein [Planctomycetota bacterium]